MYGEPARTQKARVNDPAAQPIPPPIRWQLRGKKRKRVGQNDQLESLYKWEEANNDNHATAANSGGLDGS